MLRMSYMPSDFHPILLILGEAEELHKLADILEEFSSTGGTIALNEAGVFSSDTQVRLEEIDLEQGIKPGLWPLQADVGSLVWKLPKKYAWIFSNEVANLATSGETAGSVTLECDVRAEVRVKVSIGEWEEGYLTDDFR